MASPLIRVDLVGAAHWTALANRISQEYNQVFTGFFAQEELGVETPIWESIPTSIQTIIGVAAVMGAGWTWFVRPRVIALVSEAVVSEAVAQINKERNKALAEMCDKLRDELRAGRSHRRA